MKNSKLNLPLCIGLLLLSVMLIVNQYAQMPAALHCALSVGALGFELWGVILLARSPALKNSKLRQWKLRLFCGKQQ